MLISLAANTIAKRIKSTNAEQTSSIDVLTYGLIIILNTSSIIFISVIYGLIFSKLEGVIIALVSFAVLRFFTGGHHVENSDLCVLISVMIVIISTSVTLSDFFSACLGLITILLLIVYSPFGVDPRVRAIKMLVKYFKYVATVIVVINIVWAKSEVCALSFFIQAITLINSKEGQVD